MAIRAAIAIFVLGWGLEVQSALDAQAIPRDAYLKYVPLVYPTMVRQTDANAAFHLFGDRSAPEYRDVAPVDGIDDGRHRVLLALSIRFAPYLVQNTTAIPVDFRQFLNRSRSFPLFVDTWEVSGSIPDLVASDEMDWVALATHPCHAFRSQQSDVGPDCRLSALLDQFDPLVPGPSRSTRPDSSRFTVMFFDFPGDGPDSWRAAYEDPSPAQDQGARPDMPMISSHPFIVERIDEADGVVGFEFVLQYWFFYPYNDGGNNHEGDWEHVNVQITPLTKVGQDMSAEDIYRILDGGGVSENAPDQLVIKRIDYYFHNKVFTLDYTRPNVYAPRAVWEEEVEHTPQERRNERWYWRATRRYAYDDDDETVINTHPIAFIGADNKGTDQLLSPAGRQTNRDSHGTFPFPALYKGIGPANAAEQITQHFDHRAFDDTGTDVPGKSGPRFGRGHVESFADPEKILVLPDGERVVELVKSHAAARRDWAWLVLPIRWGYPAVESPFAGVIAHAETGNLSPVGPSYNSGWNRTGDARGYEAYVPNKFGPLAPGSWQDGFVNSWGWLNLTLPTVAVLPPFNLLNDFVIQPVRALFGVASPFLIPSQDVPYRFIGIGGGASWMMLDIDFVDLLINEDQVDDIVQRLTDFSATIGDSTIAGTHEFVHTVTSGYAEISIRLGNRFASENTLRHGVTSMGVDVPFPESAAVWELRARLNFWEYSGSLRYDLGADEVMPYLRVGYGLSWYRVEDVTTNGVPLEVPHGPWVRRPAISRPTSLLPNTWHIGVGLEWVPIRSQARLPRGMDVSVRGDVALYFHKFGGRIPFDTRPWSMLAPGVLGELPQNPIMTRPVVSLALIIGL